MSCNNAIAIFNDTNVKGSVRFHQCLNQPDVSVIFDLYNLPKNQQRAIHIHEFGDMSNGCMSLGGHYNPENKKHGSYLIDIQYSHAGDLINNLKSDTNGRFYYEYTDTRLKNIADILGRSVVIHEGVDDLGQTKHKDSKTTGNAGSRMGCAIIGIAKNGRLLLDNE